MIRILQNTPGTISQEWHEDGDLVDPGPVTVTVTRADGTELVSGASASGTGAAARTYNLTQAHTLLLDVLTVTWVSGTKGTLTSVVEVVGGFLFSISELRAMLPDTKTAQAITDDQIKQARIFAEQALEDEADVAFVPRYYRETFSGTGVTTAMLRWPKVT